jgi:transcription elongation regulator 1
VFYTNKAKKESVWTIPDEIKDAVELLNKQEEDDKIRTGKQAQEETRSDVEAEQEREIERVRTELQEVVVKRKAEDIPQSDEIVISKKPRVEDRVGGEVDEADDTGDSEESEEEDWQREAAAQLAKEAEEEERRQREEDEKAKAEEAQRAKESAPQITMPDRVDLSIEEGKALFKVRLQRNISLVPFKLSRVACTDLTPGERHKSFTSLGYVSSALHI